MAQQERQTAQMYRHPLDALAVPSQRAQAETTNSPNLWRLRTMERRRVYPTTLTTIHGHHKRNGRMHTKQESEGGLDMTTHEKAKFIETAQSWISSGELSRDKAGEWESQYMMGWHGGSGNEAIKRGNELLDLIDVLEIVNGVEA